MDYKELKECLVCGNTDLKVHCDLGLQPLVNNLKDSPSQEEKKFPIIVNECKCCTHKQLSIAVSAKLLFENYLYQTGTSWSHVEFFHNFAYSIHIDFNDRLEPPGSILDIGSNDGSLLNEFRFYEWEGIGVEPSEDLANKARLNGSYIISDFFPTNKIENRKFDVVTAFNVFAHNDNPYLFLTEAAKLLNKDGRIYLLTTPARLDNYYHEHISYFTPQSMMVLAARCGLEVKSFKTTTMHGESYLFELAAKEQELSKAYYCVSDFTTIGYGASASGIVLMNYFGFKPEYVVDDNLLKQGKYIPGTDIRICSQERLKDETRDLSILVLAHHLFNEIVAKVKALRPNKKDVFIHPFKGVL